MSRPGVTIHAPPIPKKPPMMPAPKPRMISPGKKIGTPAIGIITCNQSIFPLGLGQELSVPSCGFCLMNRCDFTILQIYPQ
jgi:hypothetical protein